MMAHMDGVVAAEIERRVRFWIQVKVKPVGFPDGQDVACEGVRIAKQDLKVFALSN